MVGGERLRRKKESCEKEEKWCEFCFSTEGILTPTGKAINISAVVITGGRGG